MKRKREEAYQITPKGVVMLAVDDLQRAQAVLDGLELFALRSNCNALIFSPEPRFVKIYLEK